MKKTRRELRIEIMNLLYQSDLYAPENIPVMPELDDEEIRVMYHDIMCHQSEIDHAIETSLFDYKLSRLAYVDRAIIRLAVYEMLKTDLAHEVIIDEAVELTKIYSNLDDQKQHKFTNRLLDNISRAIKG